MLEGWRGTQRLRVLAQVQQRHEPARLRRRRAFAARWRVCARVRRSPVIALMTHFADADLPGGADEAVRRFVAACGGAPEPRSLANSAAR